MGSFIPPRKLLPTSHTHTYIVIVITLKPLFFFKKKIHIWNYKPEKLNVQHRFIQKIHLIYDVISLQIMSFSSSPSDHFFSIPIPINSIRDLNLILSTTRPKLLKNKTKIQNCKSTPYPVRNAIIFVKLKILLFEIKRDLFSSLWVIIA